MNDVKNRLLTLGAVIVAGLLFLYPTFRVIYEKLTHQEVSAEGRWISRPISLGLDLNGGVQLLYQVKTDDAVLGRLQVIANVIRADLRKEKIAVTKAQVNKNREIEIVLFSARSLDQARKIIQAGNPKLVLNGEGQTDTGQPVLRYGVQEREAQDVKRKSVVQAVETLRNRIDQFGVSEPLIHQQGADRLLLQMPGYHDIETVKKVVGRVARLEFRLVPRPGVTADTVELKDHESGAKARVEDTVQMTGEYVNDAYLGQDEHGRRTVNVSFTSEGRRLFGKITSDNVGRQLGIILDNEVYSSPVIREPIRGGNCQISGNFSTKEAHDLAVVLKAGALPAPLEVMEERTVGPTLGAESIRSGIIAIIISFLAVFVFMWMYYRKSGLVAMGTLALNVFLLLALLSLFGATLTLPGLAGLALTVGMAVDSNVIIFERIRDEIRNGSSRDVAVTGGFHKAFSAILDSNLTTLLSGLLLYFYGTGPIRGFAVTLSIGIVTTLFCATFVARLLFDAFELRSGEGLSI